MQAKLLRKQGSSSLIVCLEGVPMAYIVDTPVVEDVVIGDVFDISSKTLTHATPYGIDWAVVFPDGLCVEPGKIQEVLYSHGVIGIDDLKSNPNALIVAVRSLIDWTAITLYMKAKQDLGG